MKKKIFKILPVFALGLMTLSTPVHADESIFDSFGKAFQSASNAISNQINQWTGGDSQDASAAASMPSPTPSPSPSPSPSPTGPNLSQCRQFLSVGYDPSEATDPQKVATVYLNGLLDFTMTDPDATPSDAEIAQRNDCIGLALDAGADPNSNGEYSDPNGADGLTGLDDELKDIPIPLARAVNDNDEPAVKMLLAHKADPNAADTTMGNPIPLLRSAVANASQSIALDLINAGADVTIPDLLWSAAGNAADQVVEALIQSKKIPVNQVDKLSDLPDDDGETALDVSEQALDALKGYQKKFPVGSNAALQSKIEEANHILYYIYPLKPQLKSNAADPDAFISDLLTHQQNVSNSLKAAGWTCQQDNCGIVDLDANEMGSEPQT